MLGKSFKMFKIKREIRPILTRNGLYEPKIILIIFLK